VYIQVQVQNRYRKKEAHQECLLLLQGLLELLLEGLDLRVRGPFECEALRPLLLPDLQQLVLDAAV
jgi:hypothetical protein